MLYGEDGLLGGPAYPLLQLQCDLLQRVSSRWQDANDCNEIVEALLNYTSCVFMVRPWDWTGIVLLRACHDMCYFGRVTTCARAQRTVMESFIDEVII